jgi:hypothetical protein
VGDVLKVASSAIHGEGSKKVFIAMWSLSEAPFDVRMTVEKTIVEGSFTHVFIAYQKMFGDNFGSRYYVDNDKFFVGFSARLETAMGMKFRQIDLEGGNNVLLVGERPGGVQ